MFSPSRPLSDRDSASQRVESSVQIIRIHKYCYIHKYKYTLLFSKPREKTRRGKCYLKISKHGGVTSVLKSVNNRDSTTCVYRYHKSRHVELKPCSTNDILCAKDRRITRKAYYFFVFPILLIKKKNTENRKVIVAFFSKEKCKISVKVLIKL